MNRRTTRLFALLAALALASSLNYLVFHRWLIINTNNVGGDDVVKEMNLPRPENSTDVAGHHHHPPHGHNHNHQHQHTQAEAEEDNNDDEDDPFATQNPQGERWTSQSKHENAKYWWQNSDSCFEVDHICRSSRNQWFYYYHPNDDDDSSTEKLFQQPSLELKYMPYFYRKAVWADTRMKLVVHSTSRVPWENFVGSSSDYSDCHVSPVAHHVVLQSVFNDMIGEFYVRTLLNLYTLFTAKYYANNDDTHSHAILHNNHSSTTTTTATTFIDEIIQSSNNKETTSTTQFYLHITFENKKMLHAHRLFMTGMMMMMLPPNNNNNNNNNLNNKKRNKQWATVREAIDLVRPSSKTENNKMCQCYRKLVFCGYNVYSQKNELSNINNNHSHGNDVRLFNSASSSLPTSSSFSVKERTPITETNYTLWPAKHIDAFGHGNVAESPEFACNPVKSHFQERPFHCEAYSKLKTYLVANLEGHYMNRKSGHHNHNDVTTTIEETIAQYRRDVLSKRKLIDADTYGGDTKEWIFVGLAQRSLRRSWINLPDVMDACNAAFLKNNNKFNNQTKKVLCVEINVENAASPEEQFVMHRTLDVLIGIHGAQLTQAVLLPPGAHVLELLPWIPDYARGDWTQTTRHPTPLGVIFHNSQLNHFGYSLDRSSVHYLCQNVSKDEERGCFTNKENERKFQWDNRDFVVEANDVVIRFLRDFVLPMRNDTTNPLSCRCEDLLGVQQDRFVLYNVWCIDDDVVVDSGTNATAKPVVRHYYREALSNADIIQSKEVRHYHREALSNSNTDIVQSKEERTLHRCPLPINNSNNPTWNYYNALVDENMNTAYRAKSLSDFPTLGNEIKSEEGPPAASTSRIPHRLIFTHKHNLFDCSKSAASHTSPDLYNFAENAKATVRAYSEIWPDLEYVFLTDQDCIEALNQTEPGLISWFNSGLAGMYKADLCRSAYLTLHGGYYFDVDLLVVRPFVAPNDTKFATVRGDGWPRDGFFQAFLAAEKGNAIVHRSLKIMLDALYGERPQGKYLGPTALMEAWMEVNNIANPSNVNYSEQQANGVYLLAEVDLGHSSVAKYKKLANVIASVGGIALTQHVPIGHGDRCQFSGGACNVVVINESDETLYFYSRVLGTKWCGAKVHEEGECTTEGDLLKRISHLVDN